MPRLSRLARDLKQEVAFVVLARARTLKAAGKDIVELEIGDSPFPSPPHAKEAGIRAIEANRTGYAPSVVLPDLRMAAAQRVHEEFGLPVEAENIVVGSGAKPFEQYFAEALLEPDDGVLLFAPQFPTYLPNLERRGARSVIVPLRPENQFRPRASDVAHFLATDPRPRAVFLNSPHNPTGGVATEEDLAAIADVVRDTDLMVFSDEPYAHMVWQGRHHSILAQPGMLPHVVAAYSFSKSYSMSGWRIGFAAASPDVVNAIGGLINTTASCAPPFVQEAAIAALDHDADTRDQTMRLFEAKVDLLTRGLASIDGMIASKPAGTFYVFPDVRPICNRLGLTSHGLAMYLMEGADDHFGVACLGGESFGDAGAGFLRFSCAESDDRIEQAVRFLPDAFSRPERVQEFLSKRPDLALKMPYPTGS